MFRHILSKFAVSAVAALTFCFLGTLSLAAQEALPSGQVTIRTADGKSHDFTVELATTNRQREQGLMFRKTMAPMNGMLFDFGTDREVTMWMRNTLIPLDMLF